MANIGLIFSKPKDFGDVLSPMGAKRPVYEEMADVFVKHGHKLFIVSTRGYLGNGVFEWYWEVAGKNVTILKDESVHLDVAYDRSGGLNFPLSGDSLRFIDNLDFKKFAWDKWEAYKILGEFMSPTYFVGSGEGLELALKNIKTDWVVLKPKDGLKGKGIYIGDIKGATSFEFLPDKDYIAQDFVDTTHGIAGIVNGIHDLRCVIINGKIVWSHVRTPPVGEYKSNVAGGGNLQEIPVGIVPTKIKEITQKVSELLYNRFDNPIYSVDFGVDKDGRPYIFEINDQMGFPKIEMAAKDSFLEELVKNLESKI